LELTYAEVLFPLDFHGHGLQWAWSRVGSSRNGPTMSEEQKGLWFEGTYFNAMSVVPSCDKLICLLNDLIRS
jgi:hypothetical protein